MLMNVMTMLLDVVTMLIQVGTLLTNVATHPQKYGGRTLLKSGDHAHEASDRTVCVPGRQPASRTCVVCACCECECVRARVRAISMLQFGKLERTTHYGEPVTN